MKLIDSHCHLDRLDLSEYGGKLDAALDAARQRDVGTMLCIGVSLNNADEVIRIANQYDDIYASVGIHPMDVGESVVSIDQLNDLLSRPKVVAVGETGLDYYYAHQSKDLQLESFKLHLKLSSRATKPIIVHTRDARDDTLSCIKHCGDSSVGGVLHCFTESWEMAKAAIDENYYISFSGIVTFKNASELREVVKKTPIDRLLIETDSPYLAPVPYRGKKNEPKYVVEVAQCVADIKGIPLEELAERTAENFKTLFLS